MRPRGGANASVHRCDRESVCACGRPARAHPTAAAGV